MNSFIYFLLILPLFFSSINLSASIYLDEQNDNYEEVTEEKMEILKLLIDKKLMLTFISHPKTMNYFLSEKKSQEDYLLSLKPQIESLETQFPNDPLVEQLLKAYSDWLNIIENRLPFEDVVMPFLAWGLADISGVNDYRIIKKIQDFQIKLFKNYLFHEGIALFDEEISDDLEHFCNNSPLDIFSKIIHPLILGLRKNGAEIDYFPSRFSSAEGVTLSLEQQMVLEGVYDPLNNLNNSPFPKLKLDFSVKIDSTPLFENEDDDDGDDEYPSEVEIRKITNQIEEQNFFSLEKLYKVFLEVMTDSYPEKRKFFESLQKHVI